MTINKALGVCVMVRLFMSVDMVGSTVFKAQLTGEGSGSWLKFFKDFFYNFPLMVAGQIGFEFLDDETTPAINIWKVMGDEVLFVATPETPEEITAILIAVLRTMRLYEDRHLADLPLRLKGTAWLADFDGHNIEIEIPELSSDESGVHVDFIGPDIDVGFRITKFARAGCMALSLDVVEQMLQASNLSAAALHLVGAEPLKGVMFGRPYPIVWMHAATDGFTFLPWEIEADPLIAAAVNAKPTPTTKLQEAISNMRHYLKKMHRTDRPPLRLGS